MKHPLALQNEVNSVIRQSLPTEEILFLGFVHVMKDIKITVVPFLGKEQTYVFVFHSKDSITLLFAFVKIKLTFFHISME